MVLLAFLLCFVSLGAFAKPGDDPGFLKLRGAAFPIAEEAGEVEIVVRRNRGNDGAISVAYTTVPGTAEAGVDYLETDGVLEWADGDRSDKSFLVVILDDDQDEGQETFGVVLSEPEGGATLSPPSTGVVRIKPSDRNDDQEPDGDDGDDGDDGAGEDAGVLKLTKEQYAAFESSGTASFSVERDDGDQGVVTVEYLTLDGSATEGADYVGVSGVLEWADGETGEKTVELTLFDDTEAEDTETITIILTNATGGATLGARDSASLQIIDDDGAIGGCVADEETLCLGNGRFQITGTWTDFTSNSGPFQMVPGTDDSGFAWFFDEDNLELLIKVLDGCAFNGYYWVFFAATTNVGFEIEVQDLVSGESQVYTNPLGVSPETTTDTTAFATCNG